MKTGKLYKEQVDVSDGRCCGTVAMEPKQNAPFRKLLSDGSSCCDKSESKAVHLKETSCC